jgi:hypothetical protein
MIKIDSLGNVSWAKSYSAYGMDKAAVIGKNRYAVYGNFVINYWPYQITSALHVIDSTGTVLYNYLIPESLIVNQMHPTRNGGIIAVSEPNGGNRSLIFKTDSTGILEWTKSIDSIGPNSFSNRLTDITEARSNGYMGIMNYTYPDTIGAAYYSLLIRLDSLGDTLWTKSFDFIGWNLRILSIPSNEYLIYQGNEIALFDSSGQVKWRKFTVDTITGIDFHIMECKLSNDDNFILTAEYYDVAQNSPANCLMKVDTNGVVLWLRSYPLVYPANVRLPLVNAKDDGFAFASLDLSNQQCTLIKTDSLGASRCDSSLTVPVFLDTTLNSTPVYQGIHPVNLQLTDTLGAPNSASISSFTVIDNCLMLKNNEIFSKGSFKISPVPATSQFTISSNNLSPKNTLLEIFNLLGENIYSAAYRNGSTVNCEHFLPGIYFVRLSDSEKQLTQKLVVE